jgi:hypothetical protein
MFVFFFYMATVIQEANFMHGAQAFPAELYELNVCSPSDD